MFVTMAESGLIYFLYNTAWKHFVEGNLWPHLLMGGWQYLPQTTIDNQIGLGQFEHILCITSPHKTLVATMVLLALAFHLCFSLTIPWELLQSWIFLAQFSHVLLLILVAHKGELRLLKGLPKADGWTLCSKEPSPLHQKKHKACRDLPKQRQY